MGHGRGCGAIQMLIISASTSIYYLIPRTWWITLTGEGLKSWTRTNKMRCNPYKMVVPLMGPIWLWEEVIWQHWRGLHPATPNPLISCLQCVWGGSRACLFELQVAAMAARGGGGAYHQLR